MVEMWLMGAPEIAASAKAVVVSKVVLVVMPGEGMQGSGKRNSPGKQDTPRSSPGFAWAWLASQWLRSSVGFCAAPAGSSGGSYDWLVTLKSGLPCSPDGAARRR